MSIPIGLLRWRGVWLNGETYSNYDVALSPLTGTAYVLNNGNTLSPSVVDPSVGLPWVALPSSSSPSTQPTTLFNYVDYVPSGSLPLPDDPLRAVVQTLSYTPPTNGTLYMECIARCIGNQTGAAAVFQFRVNGALLVDPTPAVAQAYAGNINFLISTMNQISVTAGTPYTVDVMGGCSALPPAGSDAGVLSSRLMLLFTPV